MHKSLQFLMLQKKKKKSLKFFIKKYGHFENFGT
jgi:hypothetical protein